MPRLYGFVPLLMLVILAGTSCTNIKPLQYVQGEFDTTRLGKIEFAEPLIQRGDLLGITVYSDDMMAAASIFPSQGSSSSSSPANAGAGSDVAATSTTPVAPAAPGFLVDSKGDIALYKLGVIHAEGKTKKQLADTLSSIYAKKELLKNPFTEVRFLNSKITLIGEVTRPGTYTLSSDHVSMFEALGYAGDMTIYGRRDNVLVIRESNGVRQFGRVDLGKPDAFLSPFYYLQQNDKVIVDVHKNKSVMTNQGTYRTITVIASVISITAILLNVFK